MNDEPMTEAGKRLLRLAKPWPGLDRDEPQRLIAAIEAEARAAVLRELREEVAGMNTQDAYDPWETTDVRAAVLAAIDRRLVCQECGHALAAHTTVTNDGCMVEECLCEQPGIAQ